jgi:hypothetical protein
MTGLIGAYVLWRIARRLVPLVLVAAVTFVALAPDRQLSGASRRLRRQLQLDVRQAQRSLAHGLEMGLRRR